MGGGGVGSMNASPGLCPLRSFAKRMCHDGRRKRVALEPLQPPFSSPEVRRLGYLPPWVFNLFFLVLMFAGTSAVRGRSRRGSCAVTTEPSSPDHIERANHPHRPGGGGATPLPLLLMVLHEPNQSSTSIKHRYEYN